MTSVPCWRHGCHDWLAVPWGQLTRPASQSMAKAKAVYPPVRACRLESAASGPVKMMPRARASMSVPALV